MFNWNLESVANEHKALVKEACERAVGLVRVLSSLDYKTKACLHIPVVEPCLFVEIGLKQLFWMHFRVVGHSPRFREVMNAILEGEAHSVIKVFPGASLGAYACADIKCGEITLDPSFFRLSSVEQILTLFHELTHIFSYTQDIYPGNSTPEPGFVRSDWALVDAYSYERFARDYLLGLSVNLVGGNELGGVGADVGESLSKIMRARLEAVAIELLDAEASAVPASAKWAEIFAGRRRIRRARAPMVFAPEVLVPSVPVGGAGGYHHVFDNLKSAAEVPNNLLQSDLVSDVYFQIVGGGRDGRRHGATNVAKAVKGR